VACILEQRGEKSKDESFVAASFWILRLKMFVSRFLFDGCGL
jgi:hypothetical protein